MSMSAAASRGLNYFFIDAAVSDYQDIVENAPANTLVTVIEPTGDPLLQIAQVLELSSEPAAAIHILSHGGSGELLLGGQTVDIETLRASAAVLERIGGSLSEDGDILLYGCEVGAGEAGEAFIAALAEATTADVAASDDPTGAAALGGDWQLETQVGTVESDAITWAGQAQYGYLLATDQTFDSEPVGQSGTASTVYGDFTFTGDGGANIAIIDSGSNIASGADRAVRFDSDFATDVNTVGFSTTDGSEFALNSLEIDSGLGDSTVTITGKRDGLTVQTANIDLQNDSSDGGATYDATPEWYGTITFTGWDNIDEIVISGTSLDIDLDDIDVGPAVIPNNAPTVSSTPTDITVTEDAASNVDLSSVVFADSDGDSLTVTLTIDAGTFGTPADGSGVGAGVTETLVNSTTITLAGTAADINTYLDTASNIQYTGASDANGDDVATLTITLNDGTTDGTAATVNIDITAVNDAPAFSGLDGAPSFTEGDPAVTLDANVTLSDVELAAANDYADASLTIARNGGANADDSFSFDTTGALFTVSGGNLQSGGQTFATFTNSSGTLTINFTSSGTTATQALVNDVMQRIQYQNTSDDPSGSAQLDWTFSDGNSGGQGTGGAATATGSTTVTIAAVNDPPVVGNLDGDNSAVQAGGSAVNIDAGGNATVSNVDSTDYNGGSLTIVDTGGNNTVNGNFAVDGTNVTSGGDGTIAAGETISVGGVAIGTMDATNDGQGDNTLTINFNSADATNARVQTLLQNLTWSAAAGSGAQTFTATLNDGDGTANSGDEDTAVSFTMTIGNSPSIANLDGDSVNFQEGDNAVALDSGGDATLSDADAPANLNGGNLTATVSANAAAGEDILTLDTSGTVALAGAAAGSNVSVGGTVVGTLGNNVAAGNDLVVNLNTNATLARVQTLMQAVAYDNNSENPTESTRSVQISVTDNDGLTSAATTSVAVTAVNDAPSLDDTAPGMGGTDEDTAQSLTVSDFLGSVTDPDAGTQSGIAITGASGNGTWHYSVDGGGTWSVLGGVSEGAARLLLDTDRLRYQPDGESGETASLSYRAWDQTSGTAGATADVTTNGGTTAFSTNTATATLTVADVNDAPTLTAGTMHQLTGTDEDTPSSGTQVSAILAGTGHADVDTGAVSGVAITAATGNGAWQYSTDGGVTWQAVGSVSEASSLLLRGSESLHYQPDGENGETAGLTFRAWDQTSGGAGSKVDVSTNGGTTAFSANAAQVGITVTDVNDAPTVSQPIADQAFSGTGDWSFTLPNDVFADVDTGDTLTLTAKLDNGDPLPDWLGFAADTRTFSGNPPAGLGSLALTVTATDQAGATASDTFTLTLSDTNDRPSGADFSLDLANGDSYTFAVEDFGFVDPDMGDSLQLVRLVTLPAQGLLTLEDIAVSAGGDIAVADIESGLLRYAAGSGSGNDLASFQFTVSDGLAFSAASNTVGISVAPPPPPPPEPDLIVVTPSPGPVPETPSGQPAPEETITNIGTVPGSARLVENSGNANVVTATLPGGVSLVNQGARTAIDSGQVLADLQASITGKQPNNLLDQLDVARQWLDSRPDGTRLDIRTLTLSADRVPDSPIRITGNTGEDDTQSQEAFVINVTGLPSGSRLELDNIDFASIKGAITITGGAGDNVVIGDDAAQVIVLGPGDDVLYGGGGDDEIGSQGGNDRLYGEAGDDTLYSSSGINQFHGGTDRDTARFEGNREDYLITQEHAVVRVQSRHTPENVDTLINIETLAFADDVKEVSYDEALSWIAGLYGQVLGRQADIDGIQYWAAESATGFSAAEIAMSVLDSEEAALALNASTPEQRSNTVNRLYEALLGRAPDEAGKAYWLDEMEAGASVTSIVGGFMASEEMRAHAMQAEEWNFIA